MAEPKDSQQNIAQSMTLPLPDCLLPRVYPDAMCSPARVSSVKLSYSCFFHEVRKVYCSADGDNLNFIWTSESITRLEDDNKTLVLDKKHNEKVTCHVTNQVSLDHNSIELNSCTAKPIAAASSMQDSVVTVPPAVETGLSGGNHGATVTKPMGNKEISEPTSEPPVHISQVEELESSLDVDFKDNGDSDAEMEAEPVFKVPTKRKKKIK
ncbi:hypothetical protein QTP86_004242, partial [Hemibagrus guttatus]